MSSNEYENNAQGWLCDWCGNPTSLGDQIKNLVCPDCSEILTGAGISDEVIYQKDFIDSRGLLAPL